MTSCAISASELAGLTFEAQLALDIDSRTGRSFNAIATIVTDDEP